MLRISVIGAAEVLRLILGDKADVGLLISVEDAVVKVGGGDGAPIPGLGVEVRGDGLDLEDPPVTGIDLVSGQAEFLMAQILQVRLRQVIRSPAGLGG